MPPTQQINLRRANEAIARGRLDRESAAFVCECGHVGCNTTITLTREEYRAVRTSFERFLVAPGHEAALTGHIVEAHRAFAVVVREAPA